MLTSPWVVFVGLPAGFAALTGLAAAQAGGFWNGAAPVFAGMGVLCVGLGATAVADRHRPDRLAGGPTASRVRARAATLFAEHPGDTPAELAARVRAWFGGGTVGLPIAVAGTAPAGYAADGCLLALFLAPAGKLRGALAAPTPAEFDRSVSDAVAAVTGQPPPAGGAW